MQSPLDLSLKQQARRHGQGRKPENQNRVSTHYLFVLRLKSVYNTTERNFYQRMGFLYDTHQSDRLFNCQIANINVIKLRGIHLIILAVGVQMGSN